MSKSCPACLASRRATVDAFFLGFRAGYRDAIVSTLENRGIVPAIKIPVFCVAHDKMLLEAYASEMSDWMKLVKDEEIPDVKDR